MLPMVKARYAVKTLQSAKKTTSLMIVRVNEALIGPPPSAAAPLSAAPCPWELRSSLRCGARSLEQPSDEVEHGISSVGGRGRLSRPIARGARGRTNARLTGRCRHRARWGAAQASTTQGLAANHELDRRQRAACRTFEAGRQPLL